MKNGKFEVRDVVKGKPESPYGITNEGMLKGKVLCINNDEMLLEVVEHDGDWIGGKHWVKNNKKYFELIECITDNPIKKSGEIQKILYNDFIRYIDKAETLLRTKGYDVSYDFDGLEALAIALYSDTDVAVIARARCHPKDIYIEEVGKAIALERIVEFLDKK